MLNISAHQLELLCDRINMVTGMPRNPYETINNKLVPQAGCFYIEYQNGNLSLRRMSLTSGCTGSENTVNYSGTKRELWHVMHAFLTGLNFSTTERLYREATAAQPASPNPQRVKTTL